MIVVEKSALAIWQRERIRLRRKIFSNEPNWAAYPDFVDKKILNQKKNPFWKNKNLITILGKRSGVTGCTVALIVPAGSKEATIWFGFFDAVFDPGLVAAVFNELENAARALGISNIVGPANPNLYYEPGIQIDGFRCSSAPGLAMSPPYYAELLDGLGFTKANDLLGLVIPTHSACPPALRYAARLGKRQGITITQADLKQSEMLIEKMAVFHAASFDKNWGEPRLSRDDVAFLWSMFRDMIDRRLVLLAHDMQGELVGLALAIPNRTKMFRKLKRAKTPIGSLLAMASFSEVDSARLAIFGIHPDHRLGPAAGALLGALWEPVQSIGARFCEISWVLENNHNLLAMLESVGAIRERRWRVFTKSLN
jgi:hypothetical protein